MKCPYHSEMGCAKFDLLPCVGLDNCAYMNGSSNLLQGIQTPYAELKARAEKAESELKAIKDRIEAIKELPTIENGQFIAECRWNAGYNTAIYDCKEIIKQIGSVK